MSSQEPQSNSTRKLHEAIFLIDGFRRCSYKRISTSILRHAISQSPCSTQMFCNHHSKILEQTSTSPTDQTWLNPAITMRMVSMPTDYTFLRSTSSESKIVHQKCPFLFFGFLATYQIYSVITCFRCSRELKFEISLNLASL